MNTLDTTVPLPASAEGTDNQPEGRPVTLAIFASGTGTNCENIINYFKDCDSVRVGLVVCNKPDAPVLEKAARLGVRTLHIPKEELAGNESGILELLRGCDYLILAGFLLKIPSYLINEYSHRIINIHPSLLPKFGGKGMWGAHVHKAVVEAGEKESGITIHYVDEGMDTGQIIAQFKTVVDPGDSPEDVAAKVHLLEMENYPKVIEALIKG
jgi:Folate-dependent phosphoribosylglycinamide formyltransferase PurN